MVAARSPAVPLFFGLCSQNDIFDSRNYAGLVRAVETSEIVLGLISALVPDLCSTGSLLFPAIFPLVNRHQLIYTFDLILNRFASGPTNLQLIDARCGA